MNIINNKRTIDVDCTNYNKETLFLGHASDIDSTQLHFIIEPEFLEDGQNYFYEVTFYKGETGEAATTVVTKTNNELYFSLSAAITHIATLDAGHRGYLQFFVLKGDGSSTYEQASSEPTVVASSLKFPYIIEDSLERNIDEHFDYESSLWSELEQAVQFLDNVTIDTADFVDSNTHIPSSSLVKSKLDILETMIGTLNTQLENTLNGVSS